MKTAANEPPVGSGHADIPFISRLYGAFWGYFIGDALAMPTHGYSMPKRIRKDYGRIVGYRDPINPHPESTLFRTHYEPTGANSDIMHGRESEWHTPGTHFHQHLKAGDNTLNVLLGRSLLKLTLDKNGFDPDQYADLYTDFLLDPNSHNDTYINLSHRTFFQNFGRGKDVWECGAESNRIGGIALAMPLALYHAHDLKSGYKDVHKALSLTHKGQSLASAADLMVELLLQLLHGYTAEQALYDNIRTWHAHPALNFPYRRWRGHLSDEEVAEHHCKNGAAIDDALPLILFLILKYEGDFESALLANANLGGDNCPRGAILGMLAGAAGGCESIPSTWAQELSDFESLDALVDQLADKVTQET